jgi:putative transposase
MDKLVVAYRGWIDEALSQGEHFRDGKWTESVAVGSESFVTTSKEKLGVRGKEREVIGGDGSYELREPTAPYKGILGYENGSLRLQNAYFLNEIQ